jgi:hypothetical protein
LDGAGPEPRSGVWIPGLARSLSSGRALRGPVGAPRNDRMRTERILVARPSAKDAGVKID